ncbi:MAG: hypothetical protein J6W61_04715 [Bacteroidales bacterium]|nr:hypothetical protein [Bacteroidales bacterium]
MKKFFGSNKTIDRLGRTILQGIIGVFIANLDLLIGTLTIPAEYKPMIVALVMAILSPIMSELGAETVESNDKYVYDPNDEASIPEGGDD